MTPAEQQAALTDIDKRHSSLHEVDKQCASAMGALIKMIRPCTEHGITAELDAVEKALSALHAAAKRKWDAI